MLMRLFVASLLATVNSHSDSNGNGFKFIGDQHWSSEMQQQCDHPTNGYFKDSNLKCHVYLHKDTLELVRMELLSLDPLLIVYRGFANKKQIQAFLDDVERKDLVGQSVVSKTNDHERSTTRKANGTWIGHFEYPGVAEMYLKAHKTIPHVNFRSAEAWSVLSYHPGGHYAPHYDFLHYHGPQHWDYWMREFGNRMATFLLVLKTADVGGGTVFPRKRITVIPEAGDVIFWMNMNTDTSQSDLSMHGACVIKEGRKIAATLWIRQKDQPLLQNPQGPLFDPKPFLNPSSYSPHCPI